MILATTLLSAVTASGGAFGAGVRAAAIVVAGSVNVVLFTVAFRVLTARRLTIAQVRTGAIAAALVWQIIQWAGACLLGHMLKGAGATYGMFGMVLGLLTPFTDNVELTSGDRRRLHLLRQPNATRASRTSTSTRPRATTRTDIRAAPRRARQRSGRLRLVERRARSATSATRTMAPMMSR